MVVTNQQRAQIMFIGDYIPCLNFWCAVTAPFWLAR